MKSNFQKILIIQTAFIGDVILATVLIEKLHQYYPEAKIDFLLRKGNEALLKNHPKLNQVLVWNKKENKKKNLRKIIQEIQTTRYDLLVNVQRFFTTGWITARSKAKLKVGYSKNPLSFFFNHKIPHLLQEGTHEIDRNLNLVKQFTDNERVLPRLYPSKEDYEQIKQFQNSAYVCLAPASVWYTKQFPAEKWIDFMNQLPPNLKIYLLGSPDDTILNQKLIKETSHSNVENLAGKLSLLASAALMEQAKMNYVNDSAPMHLASAMNAPTSAIFCSTIPEFGFGPLSEKKSIVEVQEKLSCRPCGLHGKKECPKGHFDCAFKIDITQLLSVLESV